MKKKAGNRIWILPLFFVSFLILNNSLFIHLHFLPESPSSPSGVQQFPENERGHHHPKHRHSEAEFIIVQDMYSLFNSVVGHSLIAVSLFLFVLILTLIPKERRVSQESDFTFSGRAPPAFLSI